MDATTIVAAASSAAAGLVSAIVVLHKTLIASLRRENLSLREQRVQLVAALSERDQAILRGDAQEMRLQEALDKCRAEASNFQIQALKDQIAASKTIADMVITQENLVRYLPPEES